LLERLYKIRLVQDPLRLRVRTLRRLGQTLECLRIDPAGFFSLAFDQVYAIGCPLPAGRFTAEADPSAARVFELQKLLGIFLKGDERSEE
jgi:hypothetical protein